MLSARRRVNLNLFKVCFTCTFENPDVEAHVAAVETFVGRAASHKQTVWSAGTFDYVCWAGCVSVEVLVGSFRYWAANSVGCIAFGRMWQWESSEVEGACPKVNGRVDSVCRGREETWQCCYMIVVELVNVWFEVTLA